jgi:hypothetical protein
VACRNIVETSGQELGNRDSRHQNASSGPSGKPRVPNCDFDINLFGYGELSEIKDMLDQPVSPLVLGLSLVELRHNIDANNCSQPVKFSALDMARLNWRMPPAFLIGYLELLDPEVRGLLGHIMMSCVAQQLAPGGKIRKVKPP